MSTFSRYTQFHTCVSRQNELSQPKIVCIISLFFRSPLYWKYDTENPLNILTNQILRWQGLISFKLSVGYMRGVSFWPSMVWMCFHLFDDGPFLPCQGYARLVAGTVLGVGTAGLWLVLLQPSATDTQSSWGLVTFNLSCVLIISKRGQCLAGEHSIRLSKVICYVFHLTLCKGLRKPGLGGHYRLLIIQLIM